jgi:uncharacterized surface protein with fasciclin (FAS1) repeats
MIPNPTIHGRWRRWLAVGVLVVAAAGCAGDDDAGADADGAERAADEADRAVEDLAAALRANGLETVASTVDLVDLSEIVDVPDFTFLAPSDEAFQSLTADDLADLLADPERVAEILRNHTLDEPVRSTDLTDGMQLTTETGETITVAIDGDTVTIGGAEVEQTDIDVADGVVHVVDSLIEP